MKTALYRFHNIDKNQKPWSFLQDVPFPQRAVFRTYKKQVNTLGKYSNSTLVSIDKNSENVKNKVFVNGICSHNNLQIRISHSLSQDYNPSATLLTKYIFQKFWKKAFCYGVTAGKGNTVEPLITVTSPKRLPPDLRSVK